MQKSTRRAFLASAGVAATVASRSTLAQEMGTGDSNMNPTIYFVARTPYNYPNGRYVKRLKADSVLQWFQTHWKSNTSIADLLGEHFYGLPPLFEGIQHPVPQSYEELIKILSKDCYNNSIRAEQQAIEFLTDDDELELAYYWFDQSFADQNPDRVDFLLHDAWLPTSVTPRPDSQACTYLCSRFPCQTGTSGNWDVFKIDGVRLDAIGNLHELMSNEKHVDSAELRKMIRGLSPETSWRSVIAHISREKCDSSANKSEFRYSEHVCEFYFHEDTWRNNCRVFCQFVAFDDLWAATYPTLFSSIMRMRSRNVLFAT